MTGNREGSTRPTPTEPPEVTRVEIPVDTRAPGGTTNAYLVGGVLVDPAARTDALDAAVGVGDAVSVGDAGGTGVEGRDAGTPHAVDAETPHAIDAIAVTHVHPDHVGAVAAYAELTDAPVVAHADYPDRLADATGIEPDETVRDGDRIGETAVRAVETPGHAADHLAFAVASGGGGTGDGEVDDDATERRDLICGDLAVAEGSVVVGAPDGDLGEYLASLRRVRDADFDRLWPGHGPPIGDPAAACQRLIDHRLARERSVLGAIEGGARDVDAVLETAYEKDLSGVEDLARATVVAHLEKLLAERRIDEVWRERLDREDDC
ncbi:MBL fold metallo-hydrolase [Halorubrum pallidum]